MNVVSREEITETWTWLCDLDETATNALVTKFLDEQPVKGAVPLRLPQLALSSPARRFPTTIYSGNHPGPPPCIILLRGRSMPHGQGSEESKV